MLTINPFLYDPFATPLASSYWWSIIHLTNLFHAPSLFNWILPSFEERRPGCYCSSARSVANILAFPCCFSFEEQSYPVINIRHGIVFLFITHKIAAQCSKPKNCKSDIDNHGRLPKNNQACCPRRDQDCKRPPGQGLRKHQWYCLSAHNCICWPVTEILGVPLLQRKSI